MRLTKIGPNKSTNAYKISLLYQKLKQNTL